MLAGCAVEAPGDPIIRVTHDDYVAPHVSSALDLPPLDEPDVCELAAALPADDICSLICDPDALRQALIDAGRAPGTCYEIGCSLDGGTHVSVGVCLVSDH